MFKLHYPAAGNNDVQVEDAGAQLSLSPSKLTTTTPKPRLPGTVLCDEIC